jgi:hypothetical protein
MTNDERLSAIKQRLALADDYRAGIFTDGPNDPPRLRLNDYCTVNEAQPERDARWLIEQVEALERENRLLRQMLEGK